MPSLEDRVKALEAALGALTPAPSEALVPNYLTTDPAGNVGADFTGHVHAQGLDLDEFQGAFLPTDNDTIRWLDPADVARSTIYAFNDAGTRQSGWVWTGGLALENVAQLTGLYLFSAGPASIIARVNGVADDRKILERSGGQNISDWLQLDATTRQAVTQVEYAADFTDLDLSGLNVKIANNIAHRLANTPVSVVATPDTSSAICQVFNVGATTFDLRVQHRDAGTLFGAGTTVRARWMAAG